jgi:hypothetical protein
MMWLCLCMFSPNDDSMCDEKSVEKKKKIFSHMKRCQTLELGGSLYDVCVCVCLDCLERERSK